MNSKSLVLVAAASILFTGCTIQPRAAAPAPAAPVATAPSSPGPAPALAPTSKADASKNARQKGSASAGAPGTLDYQAIKLAIKKEKGGGGSDWLRGKVAKLDAKNLGKEGFFHINKRDKIYFTCTTRAPGFKAGLMTGTILGPEFYDDGSNAVVVSLQNCAAA